MDLVMKIFNEMNKRDYVEWLIVEKGWTEEMAKRFVELEWEEI